MRGARVLRSAAIDGRRMTAPHTMYLYHVFIPVTARGEHSSKLASGKGRKKMFLTAFALCHGQGQDFLSKTAKNDV